MLNFHTRRRVGRIIYRSILNETNVAQIFIGQTFKKCDQVADTVAGGSW
jgi:hypothetical protein